MSIGNIKSNLSSVILIPYWIAEALQRNGLALSDILDYEKIRSVVSMHDMATLMAAQDEEGSLLYADGRRTLAMPSNLNLNALWRTYTEKWTVNQGEVSMGKMPSPDYQQTSLYSGDASVRSDVTARLYGQAAKLDRYTTPFEVVNLAPKVVGVVIYPGFFDNQRVDLILQHELINALLQVFYVQGARYHEIAATSLFKRHLELLSGE